MLEVPGALMKSVSQASWSASIWACAEQGVSGAQECAYPRMVLEHNVSEGVGVPKCACAGRERQEHRVRVSTAGVNGTGARVRIPSKLEHF